MRKIIVILVCLLLIASALPLFAHGHRGNSGDRGRFWSANEHRWKGSTQHPSIHGWRGWGKAPGKGPDKPAGDPTKPPDDPVEDPGDKPGTDPVEDPGDKPGTEPVGTPGDKGGEGDSLEQLLPLDLRSGSFAG